MEEFEKLAKDFKPFQITDTSEVHFVPVSTSSKFPLIALPFGPPPIIPDLEKDLHQYLDKPSSLPLYHLDRLQKFIPREPNVQACYHIPPGPPSFAFEPKRNMSTCEVVAFKEIKLNCNALSGSPLPSATPPHLVHLLSKVQAPHLDFENDLLSVVPRIEDGMKFDVAPSKVKLSDIFFVENEEILEDLNVEERQGSIESIPGEEIEFNKGDHPDEDDTKNKECLENLYPELKKILEQNSQIPVLSISQAKRMQNLENHEWAITLDATEPVRDFSKKVPKMAMEWDFELDTFQKKAILCLEEGESVFISAHTSAGKTVIAEYAIALSRRHLTKAIYTSPIKALSNQKYRDFNERFNNVGILTGDVKINPDASCLIMTTEILRSMLYNNSKSLKDLEWVIFDEVHYVNNAERGVVWEEVLIMLPDQVNMVLLSATAPNYLKFANWIGKIKKRKIYVINTLKRPVPLEHYLYIGQGGKNQEQHFLILDSEGKFHKENYNKAKLLKEEKTSKFRQNFGSQHGNATLSKNALRTQLQALVHFLQSEGKLPVVCFTLSRKRCDQNAALLMSLDLTTKKEKDEIRDFFIKCTSRLTGSDQSIPQVVHLKNLLVQGLGVHHSGILPILKEVVEMLFQRGLVKLLFATETFAMGVNMPTRTVIFENIRKHDGRTFRTLHTSEYIQMAGRAGRRGIDPIGTVIILGVANLPELEDLHKMMLGKATDLDSQFRLTYNMILNLIRDDNKLTMEKMMRESFLEDASQAHIDQYIRELEAHREDLGALAKLDCSYCIPDLENYLNKMEHLVRLRARFFGSLNLASLKNFIHPGRIIIIKTEYHPQVPALVLGVNQQNKDLKLLALGPPNGNKNCTLSAKNSILCSGQNYLWIKSFYNPPFPQQVGYKFIAHYPIQEIQALTNKEIKSNLKKLLQQCEEYGKGKPILTGINNPDLDYFCHLVTSTSKGFSPPSSKDYRNLDVDQGLLLQELRKVEEELIKFDGSSCPLIEEHCSQVLKKLELESKIRQLEQTISLESLQFGKEFKERIEVLKRLEYIDENNFIKKKGVVARVMSTHELVLTELIFQDVLRPLASEEIAAILSCLVCKQDLEEDAPLHPNLSKMIGKFNTVAQNIGQVQLACGLEEPVDVFMEQFKFGLVPVVYEWAKGMAFSHITKLTTIQEGIIVHSIQRLYEILKNVQTAAHIIGSVELQEKVKQASAQIRRDIVFAASLYLQKL